MRFYHQRQFIVLTRIACAYHTAHCVHVHLVPFLLGLGKLKLSSWTNFASKPKKWHEVKVHMFTETDQTSECTCTPSRVYNKEGGWVWVWVWVIIYSWHHWFDYCSGFEYYWYLDHMILLSCTSSCHQYFWLSCQNLMCRQMHKS